MLFLKQDNVYYRSWCYENFQAQNTETFKHFCTINHCTTCSMVKFPQKFSTLEDVRLIIQGGVFCIFMNEEIVLK